MNQSYKLQKYCLWSCHLCLKLHLLDTNDIFKINWDMFLLLLGRLTSELILARPSPPIYSWHRWNVNWFSCHTYISKTLRLTSQVLLSHSRCYQDPLELCTVISEAARGFSGVSERTGSYGGAWKMIQCLTDRIGKILEYLRPLHWSGRDFQGSRDHLSMSGNDFNCSWWDCWASLLETLDLVQHCHTRSF